MISGASAQTQDTFQLGGLSAAYTISQDQLSVAFVITGPPNSWMGVGIGQNGMSSADIIYCSDNTVNRDYTLGTGRPQGAPLAGATCQQTAQGSTMTFTRTYAALANQNPMLKTGATSFIYAHGPSTTITKHTQGKKFCCFASVRSWFNTPFYQLTAHPPDNQAMSAKCPKALPPLVQ